jgi:flavin-dependent dehydrogenase
LTSPEWDVAVVGAGPAGCATAIALAHRGVRRVCVLEPRREPAASVGETLPPDTRALLEELGLWRAFAEQEHETCLGSCSTWGSDQVGFNDFLLDRRGSGWHLDRTAFNALLRGRAGQSGARLYEGARLVEASAYDDGFELVSQTQGTAQRLRARYVVDASGARCVFARKVGARLRVLDRLSVVYGFFDAVKARSVSRFTVLEAVPDGWWYCAPLPRARLAVAFASDPDFIRAKRLASQERWFPALLRTALVAPRLDGCRLIPASMVTRLAPSFRLTPAAGRRWLAVGDAASAHDPLSSGGLYKALSNGVTAAAALSDAVMAKSDIPNAYAREIEEDFEAFRATREHLYGLERRWEHAPFWRRRHRSLDLGTAASPPIAARSTRAATSS